MQTEVFHAVFNTHGGRGGQWITFKQATQNVDKSISETLTEAEYSFH